MKNLILVSPTGSGKMNIPLLATLVLRLKVDNPKGVCIVTQPLTSIMKQKKVNPICEAAVLSMSGDISTSSLDNDNEAILSCDLARLLAGDYPVLFAHPESFDSKLGRYILRELQKRGMLLLICIDEFHQGGEGHWSSFRPEMMRGRNCLNPMNCNLRRKLFLINMT